MTEDFSYAGFVCLKNNDIDGFKTHITKTNVNAIDINGWAIIHHVCDAMYNREDNVQFLEWLMKCGTDFFDGAKHYHYLFLASCHGGTLPNCVAYLLQVYTNKQDLQRVATSFFNQISASRSLELSWQLNPWRLIAWSFLEKGFSPSEMVFKRLPPQIAIMAKSRQKSRQAAIVVCGIRRYRCSQILNTNVMDVVKIIAQYIWQSRNLHKDWNATVTINE